MAKCDVCGRQESMPYNCRLCGGTFCGEHRLPENHNCPGLNSWGDPGGVFDSGFDDTVNDRSGRSGGVLSSVGLDTGTGGPLGYFRGNVTYVLLALMVLTFAVQVVSRQFIPQRTWLNVFTLNTFNPEYVWTWVVSIFAHGGPSHLFINGLVLYFFGPVVERRVGSRKFVALFLVTGMAAGLAQVGAALLLGETAFVLGASGAIAAVMGVLTVLNPNLRILLYFFIPMPLWIATSLFALWSVFLSASGGIGASGTAQLAHLAGLGLGVLYGVKLKHDGEGAPEQLQFGGGRGGMGGGRRRY